MRFKQCPVCNSKKLTGLHQRKCYRKYPRRWKLYHEQQAQEAMRAITDLLPTLTLLVALVHVIADLRDSDVR